MLKLHLLSGSAQFDLNLYHLPVIDVVASGVCGVSNILFALESSLMHLFDLPLGGG